MGDALANFLINANQYNLKSGDRESLSLSETVEDKPNCGSLLITKQTPLNDAALTGLTKADQIPTGSDAHNHSDSVISNHPKVSTQHATLQYTCC